MRTIKWRKIFIVASISVLFLGIASTRGKDIVGSTDWDKDQLALPKDLPENIVWMANHEIGDLRQWKIGKATNPSQDSGWCVRPRNGVVQDIVHTGKYAMKMSIRSWFPHSGCRQFRYPEIRTGDSYYYSAWLYFPKHYSIVWSNVMQFKAKPFDQESGGSVLFWSLRLLNRENGKMYFQLHWDQQNEWAGPTIEGQPKVGQYYNQQIVEVLPKKWIHVEMFLKQSSEFEGEIAVWQDGVEIHRVTGVRTKMPGGFNSWSVNSYGGGIKPDPFVVYVDDAVISKSRIGPEFTHFLP